MQFEEIRDGTLKYKGEVQDKIKQAIDKGIDTELGLDLDSLQAFLDLKFPNRKKDLRSTQNLLVELKRHNINYDKLIEYYNKALPHLNEIEKETFNLPGDGTWAQVGVIRQIIAITVDDYRDSIPEKYATIDKKYAKIIK